MNQHAKLGIGHSACPHDCPSTCALEVELLDNKRIGRVHGAKANTYTAGVICAKVARYADRVHHPDRLLKPLIRAGAKGEGAWKEASWEAALDLVAEKFIAAEQKHGSETVWPYYYAGTMGLVQRDGIERLRHAKKYSGFFGSICTNLAWTGWMMGAGALRGPDPREMAKSDCVVIWGTNAVVTQVNVMTHAIKARKERGARIVVIDVYENATMKQADLGLVLKPGTDGALACAVMHVLFREGYADRAYMDKDGYIWFRAPEAACELPEKVIGPFEIEQKLLENPGVAEAGVVGITDPEHGNIIKAYIKPAAGKVADEGKLKAELLDAIKQGCGAEWVPKEIILLPFKTPDGTVIEELPKTRSGKIMRRILQGYSD